MLSLTLMLLCPIIVPATQRNDEKTDDRKGIVTLKVDTKQDVALISRENGEIAAIAIKDQRAISSQKINDFVCATALCFDTRKDGRALFATSKGLFYWDWKKKKAPGFLVEKAATKKKFLGVGIVDMIMSPDGKYVACIDCLQQVFLLTLKEMSVCDTATLQESQINPSSEFIESDQICICFSPDSSLLSYSSGNGIVVYDINKKGKSQLKGHEGRVGSLCFIDHRQLLSGSHDQTCRIWDIPNKKNVRIGRDENFSGLALVAFSASGNRVSCGDGKGKICVFSFPKLRLLAKFQGLKSGLTGLAFIDDEMLISSGESPNLQYSRVEKSTEKE